mgnify:FL=1
MPEPIICPCSTSAWELLRASGRLLPDLLERPRTSRPMGCSLRAPEMLQEDLEREGVVTKPFHLAVDGFVKRGGRSDVICHRYAGELSRRSFIRARPGLMVSGPELAFCDMGSCSDLALIGFEMCGTYVLDTSWDGLINTDAPMTSIEKIGSMMGYRQGCAGIQKARAALELVHDGSNSPMGTVLCALLAFPRRRGGYGLGPVRLNYEVSTSLGTRYVDVAFPTYAVGLEYKGRKFHSVEQVGRDDRRQNEIVGSGITILNVWYEDLVSDLLFDRLVSDLVRAMGIRLRIRDKAFALRQQVLRARLLPAIMNLGINREGA